ncbi:MAG: hypothetical protein ACYC6N_04690 [Pirellulaceae bacterium]
MSDYPTSSWDPYRSPEAESAPTVKGSVPTGLKAICIIAIILGGFGTLISCGGFVSLAVNQSMTFGFRLPQQADMDAQAEQFQEELEREMAAISKEFLPFTVVSVVLHLVAGLLLLIGGILTLRRLGTGRLLLLVGCGVATLYELFQAVLNVVIQTRTLPMVTRSVEMVMQQGGQGQVPPGFGQMMLVIMYVILGVTLVMVLVKIVFYVVSIVYLKKPAIAALFA